jgi:NADH dehydrogenase/NADH:ubiquinone oxidoreductase subunit G
MCGETEKNLRVRIDGADYLVEPGFTVLEAARQFGVEIPTLCFDEALEPYAACRLCVVEISSAVPGKPGARGPKRVVASCVYPVEEGLEVRTSTEEILRHRRNLVELYLSRSPDAKRIQRLAEQFGIAEPRYKFADTHNCIVCGLCVRACSEIVGANAIGFGQRGMKRKVEPPFRRGSAACISCGTCTTICPTEAIRLEEIDRVQSIHAMAPGEHETSCAVCGGFELVPKAPDDYAEWLSEEEAVEKTGTEIRRPVKRPKGN